VRERRGKRRGRGVISEVINILRAANDAQPRGREPERRGSGAAPGLREPRGQPGEEGQRKELVRQHPGELLPPGGGPSAAGREAHRRL